MWGSMSFFNNRRNKKKIPDTGKSKTGKDYIYKLKHENCNVDIFLVLNSVHQWNLLYEHNEKYNFAIAPNELFCLLLSDVTKQEMNVKAIDDGLTRKISMYLFQN